MLGPQTLQLHFDNTLKAKCHPTADQLVEFTGLSRRTVLRAIAQLEGHGYLTADRGRYNNRYSFPDVSPPAHLEMSDVSPPPVRCVATGTSDVSPPPPIQRIDPVNESSEDSLPERATAKNAYESFIALANELNLPVPRCSEKRLAQIRARLKEHGIGGWQAALDAIQSSSFLRGQSESSSFTVTLDWAIKPTNFLKIIEGNYRDRAKARRGDNTSRVVDRLREVSAEERAKGRTIQ
jgi:helix-turn-helix protein